MLETTNDHSVLVGPTTLRIFLQCNSTGYNGIMCEKEEFGNKEKEIMLAYFGHTVGLQCNCLEKE